ncbi:hypothetical protein PanWU01x14_083710, partial [Parasponia andersonii]
PLRRPATASCRRSSFGHRWSSPSPRNDASLPDEAPLARTSCIGACDHRKTAKNTIACFARGNRFRPPFAV